MTFVCSNQVQQEKRLQNMVSQEEQIVGVKRSCFNKVWWVTLFQRDKMKPFYNTLWVILAGWMKELVVYLCRNEGFDYCIIEQLLFVKSWTCSELVGHLSRRTGFDSRLGQKNINEKDDLWWNIHSVNCQHGIHSALLISNQL